MGMGAAAQRVAIWTSLICAGLAVAGSAAASSERPVPAAGAAVRTWTVTSATNSSREAPSVVSSAEAAPAGSRPRVALSRRARVIFTVPQRTVVLPGLAELPRGAGRYLAFYFPSIQQGWALMPDPGSIRRWPAQLDFGSGVGFGTLEPGHRYTVLVATDRATTVPMPFPMHIVKATPASFAAAAASTPVSLLAPSAAAALGSMPDRLGRTAFTSTAIAIDWKFNPSPIGESTGDACPSQSKTGGVSCGGESNLDYVNATYEVGPLGGPQQVVFGEGFDQPVAADYVAGYAADAPIPFNAVTLLAFAIDPG
jgi:hypothetical protein